MAGGVTGAVAGGAWPGRARVGRGVAGEGHGQEGARSRRGAQPGRGSSWMDLEHSIITVPTVAIYEFSF